MASGATIDFKSMHVQYGPYAVSKGRAKGDWLNIAYNNEQFVENVGIDGEGFWVAVGDLSARATLSLQQSADLNDVFSALFLADLAAPGGLVLPFIAKEKNGRSTYKGLGRIVKFADGVWSDGGSVRTWTLSFIRLAGFVGGVGATPNNPTP